jgi:hypothetical protein
MPKHSAFVTSTVRRIHFCGTRSATTPATSTEAMSPTALRAATNERSLGLPPRSFTWNTRATIQVPAPSNEMTRAGARMRYCGVRNGVSARGSFAAIAPRYRPPPS